MRTAFLLLAALSFLMCRADAASSLTFTRHPWLSLLTPSSVLIAWQTDLPGEGKVLYAEAPPAWNEAPGAGTATDHTVLLTGLAPGTTYAYRVVCDADTLADTLSFRTAPVAETPFRFLAFGDLGAGTAAQAKIAARVDSLGADLALLTGDIIYESGEPWNFTPYYFDVYRPTISRIPFYPCLGNHDTYYDGGLTYLNEFHLPTNFPAAPERCYSFDYGNAHFVALDVTVENQTPDPALVAWLDADLAATDRSWKFVFFHVPAYSNAGSHGDDPIIAAGLDPILHAREVDLVFQGHNHFYSRTFPIAAGAPVDTLQDPHYQNPAGPIYIVTGGGGRGLHSLRTSQFPYEVLSRSVHHVTVVDVDGNTLALRAVDSNGASFDSMTLTKGPPTGVEDRGAPAGDASPRFVLGRPRPNPTDATVRFPFTVHRTETIRARIVDTRGRLIRTLEISAPGPGAHASVWDGRDDRGNRVASGVYYGVFTAGGVESRVRVTLLR